ncbi:MAG TPA: hypothetical protein P5244_09155 [Syntrophales bacterium]|nr:hypothetical protein [Syntrophales bacterium]
MRNRVFLALVIAATLIGLIGFLRPDAMRTTSREKWFWTWKTHSKDIYDVVVLGDSRVYRGISPESMRKVLTGYRILNMGYSSGSLSPMMLAEAEKRLDRSGKRIIVLGVTPYALTPKAAKDEHYLQEKNRAAAEIIENMYLAPLLRHFDPTTPVKLATGFKRSPTESKEEFYESGWVATWRDQSNPTEALTSYEHAFAENRVSTNIIDNVILQTGKWTYDGIHVFAFRLPATLEMIQLENRKSGFDEKIFRERFEKAGGCWITVNQKEYRSYDGSHMEKDSAQSLSQFIAQDIWHAIGEHSSSSMEGAVE